MQRLDAPGNTTATTAATATATTASIAGRLWVELTASTFIRYVREVKKLEGWVLLIVDSGGGQHGLHLTMEFTLLMYRNQVEVVALAEYFTKAAIIKNITKLLIQNETIIINDV